MQVSRHSSGISMSATAALTSIGSGSDGSAFATCTSGCSDAGLGDESVGAASTNNFGASGAAMVPAVIPVSGSVAGATSALTTVAWPIEIGGAASACSAVSTAARRFSTGTAAVVSTTAEPKPASQ